MTYRLDLNGTWRIAVDPENCGREQEWFREPRSDAKAVPVPGIVQQAFPLHQGVSWYWHRFTPAVVPNGAERARLRFGAVEYVADVWLNGVSVGGHVGSETPFELDVTSALLAGENLLAVRVLKPGDDEIDGLTLRTIPHRNQTDTRHFGPGASFNVAGIAGAVEFAVVPALRIADLFVRPDCASGEIAVTVTVDNDGEELGASLDLDVRPDAPSSRCEVADEVRLASRFPSGRSTHELVVKVEGARLWQLDDPCLYRVMARLGAHSLSVRCGFRDFRVANGSFMLNGKRIFLRSSHTGNHYPIGQLVAPDPDLVRRDLIMAKASGFNCIRWISGSALPQQLDFCDEIGLLAYEEAYPAWCLPDAPNLQEVYHRSYDELITRDRNHPSVAIWGLINEMPAQPVFRTAVAYLSRLRELDPTRVVLLGSGRWDGEPTIGSVSNPGSRDWEPQWGVEGPDAPPIDKTISPNGHGGYVDRAGDAHYYPAFPMKDSAIAFLREMGSGTKPVFLSECGIGSLMNVIEELRGFDRFDVSEDLFDRRFIRGMAERFVADWQRYDMDGVYPFPIDFLRASYARHSEQRRLVFDMVRSNPNFCGYNLTGLLDHAIAGEGLWSFWRRWKPGIVEALEDGWSPLRWCLFARPGHAYPGQPILLEAVLANEQALRPGSYTVDFRLWGEATGTVWRRAVDFTVTDDMPLAFPVLKETVTASLPAGEYTFAADLRRGGAPTGDRLTLRVAPAVSREGEAAPVAAWHLPDSVRERLATQGYRTETYAPGTGQSVVLVGEVPAEETDRETWSALRRDVEAGATAVLLSPDPFIKRDGSSDAEASPPWPGVTARVSHDWLYHRDCVAKRSAFFNGLQAGGVLDWRFWGEVVGHSRYDFDGAEIEVLAAGFAIGFTCRNGYESGVLLAREAIGRGRAIYNAFPVLPFHGAHPVADRLLANLIDVATSEVA
jgi:hypothetical protein